MVSMSAITLQTEPQVEPLSLDEVKLHLGLTDTDRDSEVEGLIQESRRYVEKMTGRSLITQTWNYYLDKFYYSIELPCPPLQSITSVQYLDSSNSLQTLSSVYYSVDSATQPGRLRQAYGYEYPETYDNLNAVTITFASGYGDDPEDVPEIFKRAMKLYIQWMFDSDDTAYIPLESIILSNRISLIK